MKKIIKTAFPIVFSSMIGLLVLMINMRIVGRNHPENIYLLGLFASVNYLILALFESFRALIISTIYKYKNSALLFPYLNAAMMLSSLLFIIACVLAWILKLNTFSLSMIAVSMVGSWSYILVSAIYVMKQRIISILLVVISAVLNVSQVFIYYNYLSIGVFCMPLSILVTNSCICILIFRWIGFKNHFNLSLFKTCIVDYIYKGVPVLASYITLFIGVSLFNSILLKISIYAVSGFGVAYRLQTIAMLIAISIGSAMAIENNKKSGLMLCCICYVVITATIFLIKAPIINFITNNLQIAQQANQYLQIVSPSYIFFSIFLSMTIYLEQTGRGFVGLILNAAYFLFIMIAQAYIGLYSAIAWINVLSFIAILPFIYKSKGSDYATYSESIA